MMYDFVQNSGCINEVPDIFSFSLYNRLLDGCSISPGRSRKQKAETRAMSISPHRRNMGNIPLGTRTDKTYQEKQSMKKV